MLASPEQGILKQHGLVWTGLLEVTARLIENWEGKRERRGDYIMQG